MDANYIEIPSAELEEETLSAVIEEFITREGTDYGEREFSLAQKVAQVRRRLDSGQAALVFDPVTESCTILPKD